MRELIGKDPFIDWMSDHGRVVDREDVDPAIVRNHDPQGRREMIQESRTFWTDITADQKES